MKKSKYPIITLLTFLFVISFAGSSRPWHDETHIAIAKTTGYKKWYNATGADMAKLKAGIPDAPALMVRVYGNSDQVSPTLNQVTELIADYDAVQLSDDEIGIAHQAF